MVPLSKPFHDPSLWLHKMLKSREIRPSSPTLYRSGATKTISPSLANQIDNVSYYLLNVVCQPISPWHNMLHNFSVRSKFEFNFQYRGYERNKFRNLTVNIKTCKCLNLIFFFSQPPFMWSYSIFLRRIFWKCLTLSQWIFESAFSRTSEKYPFLQVPY